MGKFGKLKCRQVVVSEIVALSVSFFLSLLLTLSRRPRLTMMSFGARRGGQVIKACLEKCDTEAKKSLPEEHECDENIHYQKPRAVRYTAIPIYIYFIINNGRSRTHPLQH
jgi:hypothetical protein